MVSERLLMTLHSVVYQSRQKKTQSFECSQAWDLDLVFQEDQVLDPAFHRFDQQRQLLFEPH